MMARFRAAGPLTRVAEAARIENRVLGVIIRSSLIRIQESILLTTTHLLQARTLPRQEPRQMLVQTVTLTIGKVAGKEVSLQAKPCWRMPLGQLVWQRLLPCRPVAASAHRM